MLESCFAEKLRRAPVVAGRATSDRRTVQEQRVARAQAECALGGGEGLGGATGAGQELGEERAGEDRGTALAQVLGGIGLYTHYGGEAGIGFKAESAPRTSRAEVIC